MNESEYTTAREGTCACGAVFTGPKCGPISALCPECRRRRKRGFGRTYYAVRRAERLANPQPVDKTGWIQCPYCHDPMPAHHDRKQCGKPECKRAFNRERANEFTAKHPGYYSKYDTANCYEHVCPVCDKTFKNHKDKPCHCSVKCWRAGQAEALRSRLLPILHPGPHSWLPAHHPAMLMQHPQAKRLFIAAVCARCGKPFIVHRVGHATYCSPSCLHQSSKDRRRAVKRGVGRVAYRRIDIFERDDWRCHIAGCVFKTRKTRRDVHWSHPLAPTIDHLIPLSKGGADAPDNVACAHRQCNSIKSDTGGAQLLLVG